MTPNTLLNLASFVVSGHEAVSKVAQNHFKALMTISDPFAPAVGA